MPASHKHLRNFQRVMAIHDLSGLGRSSLMAVTPVLSVMGMQVCPVPTAVLSTQTSGFSGYTYVDLTPTMPAYLAHWKTLGMDFDCIYSGFLGAEEQIAILEQLLDDFADPETLVVVDPVLGDDGALYDTMDAAMPSRMARLIRRADVITPNLTEVKLLLGMDAREPLTERDLPPLLARLAEMGPKAVVATGIPKADGGHTVCCYDTAADAPYAQIDYRALPVQYPGTGDIFAAVLTGGLLQGRTLTQSVALASGFISQAVADAIAAAEPVRDGVQLEKNLYRLLPEPPAAAPRRNTP